MTKEEVSKLLALAQAIDNRTVGRANIEMWHELLTEGLGDDLSFADARTALRQHFIESTDWLIPAHIVEGVKLLRQQRRRTAVWPDPPEDLVDHNGQPDFTDPVKGPTYEAWLKKIDREIVNGAHQPLGGGAITGYPSLKGNGLQEDRMEIEQGDHG